MIIIDLMVEHIKNDRDVNFFTDLNAIFCGVTSIIIFNDKSFFNSRRKKIEEFVMQLPFPHLFNANKPSRKGFRSMLSDLDVSPEEAAMIGDQLFTDVLGANRMNMYTIRVDPIDPEKEYRFTKINRIGENVVLCLREVYRSLRRFKETIW